MWVRCGVARAAPPLPPLTPKSMSVAAALAFLGENPLKRPLEEDEPAAPELDRLAEQFVCVEAGWRAQPATVAVRATEALRARALALQRGGDFDGGAFMLACIERARVARLGVPLLAAWALDRAAVLPLYEWLRRAPADAAGAWAESLRALHERATAAAKPDELVRDVCAALAKAAANEELPDVGLRLRCEQVLAAFCRGAAATTPSPTAAAAWTAGSAGAARRCRAVLDAAAGTRGAAELVLGWLLEPAPPRPAAADDDDACDLLARAAAWLRSAAAKPAAEALAACAPHSAAARGALAGGRARPRGRRRLRR